MSARGARFLVGASWWQTPGAIDSEIDKINAEIQSFDAELVAEVRHRGFDPATVQVQGFTDWIQAMAAPEIATTKELIEKGEAAQTKARQDAANAAAANVTDPVVRFYIGTWLPFKKGWDAWKASHGGSWWWNYAPDAEGFQDKLVQLRATAKRLGMKITSAEPDREGKSVFDPRRAGVGDALDEAAKIMKYAAYGAAGLGLVWGATMIINTARRR